MFFYTTGDLLQSDAEALVNTVNCEGYMGKGIAYQFKLKFPNNNKDYVKACKNGTLRPGKLHVYKESEKIIINFPTKDKWREKSRMEYIEDGLDAQPTPITRNATKATVYDFTGKHRIRMPKIRIAVPSRIILRSPSLSVMIPLTNLPAVIPI